MSTGTSVINGEVSTFEAGKSMRVGTVPSIILDNPKFGRNVSQIIRLASGYGIGQVWYTGSRVSLTDPSKNADGQGGKKNKSNKKARLPREERMKGYRNVEVRQHSRPFDFFEGKNIIPIAIELREGAQMLQHFDHPSNAVYVFGPEDGSVNSELLRFCHHLVVIPVFHCLNLSTAVATVLWERQRQLIQREALPDLSLDELMRGDRACYRNNQISEDDEIVYDSRRKK